MGRKLQDVLKDVLEVGIEEIWLQASLRSELEIFESDLDKRVIALTPETGWEGKNEGERKAAKDRALAGDPTYQSLAKNIDVTKDNQRHSGAVMEAISLKLRCIDLFVRDQTNVTGNVIASGLSAGELFDAPMPEELDAAIDDPIDEKFEDPLGMVPALQDIIKQAEESAPGVPDESNAIPF